MGHREVCSQGCQISRRFYHKRILSKIPQMTLNSSWSSNLITTCLLGLSFLSYASREVWLTCTLLRHRTNWLKEGFMKIISKGLKRWRELQEKTQSTRQHRMPCSTQVQEWKSSIRTVQSLLLLAKIRGNSRKTTRLLSHFLRKGALKHQERVKKYHLR